MGAIRCSGAELEEKREAAAAAAAVGTTVGMGAVLKGQQGASEVNEEAQEAEEGEEGETAAAGAGGTTHARPPHPPSWRRFERVGIPERRWWGSRASVGWGVGAATVWDTLGGSRGRATRRRAAGGVIYRTAARRFAAIGVSEA